MLRGLTLDRPAPCRGKGQGADHSLGWQTVFSGAQRGHPDVRAQSTCLGEGLGFCHCVSALPGLPSVCPHAVLQGQRQFYSARLTALFHHVEFPSPPPSGTRERSPQASPPGPPPASLRGPSGDRCPAPVFPAPCAGQLRPVVPSAHAAPRTYPSGQSYSLLHPDCHCPWDSVTDSSRAHRAG